MFAVRGQLNGLTTLAENIADNDGIKISYRAYHEHIYETGSLGDILLPGLNMTGDQQLFLSYAQVRPYGWRRYTGVFVVDNFRQN